VCGVSGYGFGFESEDVYECGGGGGGQGRGKLGVVGLRWTGTVYLDRWYIMFIVIMARCLYWRIRLDTPEAWRNCCRKLECLSRTGGLRGVSGRMYIDRGDEIPDSLFRILCNTTAEHSVQTPQIL